MLKSDSIDKRKSTLGGRVMVLLVHLFTASGAAVGLLALEAAFERRFAATFAWLGLALFIDGVDGTLARLARVKERASTIDGDVLDLVVDFLTYVVVPAVVLVRADVFAPFIAEPLALAVVVASALYFADTRMKTPDLWFRGFPALWNLVAFYLLVFRFGSAVSAAIVIVAIAAMFVPIVFVHPARVRQFRAPTAVVVIVFAAAAITAVWNDMHASPAVQFALACCALYVLALPFLRKPPRA